MCKSPLILILSFDTPEGEIFSLIPLSPTVTYPTDKFLHAFPLMAKVLLAKRRIGEITMIETLHLSTFFIFIAYVYHVIHLTPLANND